VADPAIVAPDNVYLPGTSHGNTAVVGDPTGLIRSRWHVQDQAQSCNAFQNVRSAVESSPAIALWVADSGITSMVNGSKYAIPAGFDKDQFGTDLLNGDVGQLKLRHSRPVR